MGRAAPAGGAPPGYLPHVVLDADELAGVVECYRRMPYVVFDVETVGGRPVRAGGTKGADVPALDERTNVVVWIALAGPGRVDIVPMGHPELPDHPAPVQLDRAAVAEAMRPLFFSPVRKVNQNVAFDTLSLSKYWGGVPPGPYTDLITLVHLLNENLPSYALGDLVRHYTGFTYAKLARDGAIDTFGFWDVARYVGLDAKVTQLLYEYLLPLYHRPGREPLARLLALESDVTEVLVHMKHHGALIDRAGLERVNAYLEVELERVTEAIYAAVSPQLAGPSWDGVQRKGEDDRRTFLVASTQQKARLLYDEPPDGLGLPCRTRTDKGARSTAEKALVPLAAKHPVVPLLLKYADMHKLHSTYSSGYVPHIGEDDRIRSSFKQSGTATGRLSSTRPNVQNVSRQSDAPESQQIRRMFVAPPGHVLVVGDFSQIEYRCMAHFAGPLVKRSRMLTAFREGIDLHAMTASGLFDVAVEDVAKEQRQMGKTANFCLIFGGSATRLVEAGLTSSEKRAKQIFDSFHRTYPEVKLFTERTVGHCRAMRHPYVETLWGRRRRLPDINMPRTSRDAGRIRAYCERQAVNHIIQGTAADINKAAMVRIFRRIDRMGYGGRMHVTLTVHDEIVLEVPEDLADAAVGMLREAMEGVKVELRVPLLTDIHYGPTWADAK